MLDRDDPFNLARFVRAHDADYAQALAELRAGRKQSHWMWFVFPQIDGLGVSEVSRFYAIRSAAEARAYLAHPLLGPRLIECSEAVLSAGGRTALEIFGSPDDMKLRSCATLFTRVAPPGSVFERLIERFFAGRHDRATLEILERLEPLPGA